MLKFKFFFCSGVRSYEGERRRLFSPSHQIYDTQVILNKNFNILKGETLGLKAKYIPPPLPQHLSSFCQSNRAAILDKPLIYLPYLGQLPRNPGQFGGGGRLLLLLKSCKHVAAKQLQIWTNIAKCSPYQYFFFWLQTA